MEDSALHDQVLRAAAGGDDVALALGLTEAAMKSRLHRARNDLRQLLANEGVVPARARFGKGGPPAGASMEAAHDESHADGCVVERVKYGSCRKARKPMDCDALADRR